MQKNWIGKSFGCEIPFKVKGNDSVDTISCFTTRPDTLHGFSFSAVSVDHPISKFYDMLHQPSEIPHGSVWRINLLKNYVRIREAQRLAYDATEYIVTLIESLSST